MAKTIFLAASMNFYPELVKIEKQLIDKGFTVIIPVSAQMMKETNDFEVAHFKGVQTKEQRQKYIQTNFKNIEKSDSILIINNEKHGVQGYIGPNVLMEIGLAFYLQKNIYIWNQVEANASCKEELDTFGVKYINQDVTNIL